MLLLSNGGSSADWQYMYSLTVLWNQVHYTLFSGVFVQAYISLTFVVVDCCLF